MFPWSARNFCANDTLHAELPRDEVLAPFEIKESSKDTSSSDNKHDSIGKEAESDDTPNHADSPIAHNEDKHRSIDEDHSNTEAGSILPDIKTNAETVRDIKWKGDINPSEYAAPIHKKREEAWRTDRIIAEETRDGQEGYWLRFHPTSATTRQMRSWKGLRIIKQVQVTPRKWHIYWADEWHPAHAVPKSMVNIWNSRLRTERAEQAKAAAATGARLIDGIRTETDSDTPRLIPPPGPRDTEAKQPSEDADV